MTRADHFDTGDNYRNIHHEGVIFSFSIHNRHHFQAQNCLADTLSKHFITIRVPFL